MMGINKHLYKVLPVSKNFGTNYVHIMKNEYILLRSTFFLNCTVYKVIHVAYGRGQPPMEHESVFMVLRQLSHTFFHHIFREIDSLEGKLHENRDLCLFCLLLYPQPLEQCLAHWSAPKISAEWRNALLENHARSLFPAELPKNPV